MKRNLTKTLTASLLAFILVFVTAGCTGDPSEDGSDVKTIAISLSIIYPDDAKKENLEGYDMQVQENATIMQILESYSSQAGIETEVDTSGAPYVTSINGVTAEDSSGWIYEVNDDSKDAKDASEYKAKDGDQIIWKYISF